MPASQQAPNLGHIKTLIIDNYDSYTFNLLQLFNDTANVMVIRNDQYTWHDFTVNILPYFDNVIVSPGPGRPERSEDFGICTELLKAQLDPNQPHLHRPVFGVCLGHQGIGHLLGGKVTYAPRIMHGRMSQVHHQQPENTRYKDIMHQCPSPFWAVRYHSLVVDKDSLPEDLMLTAYCYENDADVDALKNAAFLADGDKEDTSRNHYLEHSDSEDKHTMVTVMGFQHRHLPLWGVQFHPESVSTEEGATMVRNFQRETYKWMVEEGRRSFSDTPLDAELLSHSVALPKSVKSAHPAKQQVELLIKTSCHPWVEPELLVDELLSSPDAEQYMGWLDSSRSASPYSQMSVLSTNPAIMLTYSTLHRQVCTTATRSGRSTTAALESGTFFDYIARMLDQYKEIAVRTVEGGEPPANLDFQGGLVGYFGYEMKRESMDGYSIPTEQTCACPHHQRNAQQQQRNCCPCVEEPDAAFQFVDRFLVFNQVKREIYMCCLVVPDQSPIGFNHHQQARAWIEQQESTLLKTAQLILKRRALDEISLSSASTTPTPSVTIATTTNLFQADAEHEAYLKSIQQCVDNIREGESYEICLTTRFRLQLPKHITTQVNDPTLWRLHTRHLRKNNPAPFSALLMFPGMGLLSSSPERFLKVSKDHVAEMKPIKGTMARVLKCVCQDGTCDFDVDCRERQAVKDNERKQQLWQDVKERAENLMIVDLIRNDLAQVCEPSSVCVPKLMHVETYEKVHHLVSTIRGTLHPHVNSVEALQKCFPLDP
ncbi:unnamed protein product [Mucor fragilis]